MQSSSRILSACAALSCTLLAAPAAAHHSFAAVFQMDTVTEIEGRVTEVHWINPHIKIDVTASDGQSWEIEAGPVNLLTRMGIEKSMLEVGTTIRVRGNPGRRDAHQLWVSNILLPNGTELLAAPGAQAHWGSKTVGDASDFFVAGDRKLPAGSARSFFRIWSPLISAFPRPRGTPTLTDEGRRAQARYEGGQQAVADCEVPGMPYAMMSPYPIEIVEQGNRLLIRGEAYDLTRVVYLEPPASSPAAAPLGLSVGRFVRRRARRRDQPHRLSQLRRSRAGAKQSKPRRRALQALGRRAQPRLRDHGDRPRDARRALGVGRLVPLSRGRRDQALELRRRSRLGGRHAPDSTPRLRGARACRACRARGPVAQPADTGLPRLLDGKPDLSAPAPRTPDGKPDLSGLWSNDGGNRVLQQRRRGPRDERRRPVGTRAVHEAATRRSARTAWRRSVCRSGQPT